MERVAFLIESSGERISCLLNPESLVIRRAAGIQPRRSVGGPFTGAGLADDPLLFTGGGTTELTLDLLFDVSIAGSSVQTEDVRDLTRPLWQLAENASVVDGYSRPPLALFAWGKAWTLNGVVAAVAERLEHFTTGGAPRRSWLRMRFLRVAEPTQAAPGPAGMAAPSPSTAPAAPTEGAEAGRVHEVLGGGPDEAGEEHAPGQRLDELAYRYYGDASMWRLIAAENGLVDPLRVPGGTVLRIPPRGRTS